MKHLRQSQEHTDLSSKVLKHRKDARKLPRIRRIEVAEINADLENEQRNRPTIIQKIPDKKSDIDQTTRIAKKMRSIQKKVS